MNEKPEGVSVICVTNRPALMESLFKNFSRQNVKTKELIVILNNKKMSMNSYKKYSKNLKNVTIYQLPDKWSLGKCLNDGISKAKYDRIAKFDDDDFYSSYYLTEAMKIMSQSKADIVGKNKFYMYFLHSKKLMLANMPNENCVAGATLLFKKEIHLNVRFADVPKGTDMRFLMDCIHKGYKIESTSFHHFAALRRADQSSHTWKVSAKTIRLLRAKMVARTDRYRNLVSQSVTIK